MTGRDGARRTADACGGAIRSWRDAAGEGLAAVVAGGANQYDRARVLPRLIAFDARELSRPGPALDAAIASRLKRALRAERRRGVAGHWTYDLNRHVALAQALEAEQSEHPDSERDRT